MGNQTLESLRLRYNNSAETMRVVREAVPVVVLTAILQRPNGEIFLFKPKAVVSEWSFLSSEHTRGSLSLSGVKKMVQGLAGLGEDDIIGVKFSHHRDQVVPPKWIEGELVPAWHMLELIHVVRVGEHCQPVNNALFEGQGWFGPMTPPGLPETMRDTLVTCMAKPVI